MASKPPWPSPGDAQGRWAGLSLKTGKNRNVAKWTKGQSGNPGGRPREVGELRVVARQRTHEALDTLAEIMGDPKAPAAARVSAACAILDRGFGRPTQVLAGDPDGDPIRTETEIDDRELARKIALILSRADRALNGAGGIPCLKPATARPACLRR